MIASSILLRLFDVGMYKIYIHFFFKYCYNVSYSFQRIREYCYDVNIIVFIFINKHLTGI